jgi:hypothetical protein
MRGKQGGVDAAAFRTQPLSTGCNQWPLRPTLIASTQERNEDVHIVFSPGAPEICIPIRVGRLKFEKAIYLTAEGLGGRELRSMCNDVR